ncbi:acetoin dehydrogenase dihydrolipoyllysine-residue acetyltransferase subunit [Bradyrhizobium yuanmingense]|nr:acetoin dehydrogenase dihydrolipoyllysine-residue acetyltransferase subunit [Bradyrhizobium yuanmingense]MDF0498620.1 acetoin dehydrogenase dihydrolipoyllysine-residue acetyltransferase subunit [Bradyrhizobium yuanmingense]
MSERSPGTSAVFPASAAVTPIRMPKWGLSMEEGKVTHWYKSVGYSFTEGEDLVEIETTKINNVYESPVSGVLRRIVATVGETVPVGGLIAISSGPDVSDREVDAFVSAFQESFTPESELETDNVALVRSRIRAGTYELEIGAAGEGDAIVLIHGFASSSRSWDLNVPALTRRGRAITIDLPGHGASSKDVRSSLSDLVDSVAAAVDMVAAGGTHLVGHSLGGAVALQVALVHPDRFRSLTLIAPAGLPGSIVNRDFLDGIVEGQRARDLRPWLEMLFNDATLASQEMVDDMVRYKRIDGVEESLSVIRDLLVADGTFNGLTNRLATLPPTLIVLGDNDRIVGRPAMASLPTSWRVVTLDGAGHLPHVERASEFNELLTSFLDENA